MVAGPKQQQFDDTPNTAEDERRRRCSERGVMMEQRRNRHEWRGDKSDGGSGGETRLIKWKDSPLYRWHSQTQTKITFTHKQDKRSARHKLPNALSLFRHLLLYCCCKTTMIIVQCTILPFQFSNRARV